MLRPQCFDYSSLPIHVKAWAEQLYRRNFNDISVSNEESNEKSAYFYKDFLGLHLPMEIMTNSKMLYWLDDSLWEKLQGLLKKKVFHFYSGNMLNYQSFEIISKYCRDNQIEISAIDSSNIDIFGFDLGRMPCDENYQKCFLMHEENWKFRNPMEGGSEFFKGLSILPTQKDLLLIFTYHRKILRSLMPKFLDEDSKVIKDDDYKTINNKFYSTGRFLYYSSQLNKNFLSTANPNDFFINLLLATEKTCEKILTSKEDGAFPLIEISPTTPSE